jgi:hypothetical protein
MKYAKKILALTLTLFPLMAFAQLAPNEKITANVPFEFTVANKVVPAGHWTIQRAPLSDKTLLVQNLAARVSVNSMTLPRESKTEAPTYALVFHKYGDRYFLSGIKVEGERASYQIPENKAEAELRAENRQTSEEVIVASLK